MTNPTTTNAIITARLSAYNMIDPRAVVRKPGHNPRFDFGDTAELARSIKYQATQCGVAGGLLNAIRVKKISATQFELVDGDRRLTAVEMLLDLAAKGDPAGYDFPEGITAVFANKDQSEVTSLIQMFEANTGKSFLPLEEAAAYNTMRKAGMTIEDICNAVQRAHVHVVATLALVDADQSLKDAVASGEVGGTIAKKIAVAARGDLDKQAELTADAKAAGPKDKKALAKVKAKIEATRVAKAEASGKTLKAKVITEEQLSALGERIAKHLTSVMKEAKLAEDHDMVKWVADDEARATAFTFGVLQALKFVGGLKDVNLEV